MRQYQIESRWPVWSKWRIVYARPHSERFPFNPETKQLVFQDYDSAYAAMESIKRSNAGEYRIIEV